MSADNGEYLDTDLATGAYRAQSAVSMQLHSTPPISDDIELEPAPPCPLFAAHGFLDAPDLIPAGSVMRMEDPSADSLDDALSMPTCCDREPAPHPCAADLEN